MARKEWELLFNLSAKQNSSFSSTFKAAQSALVETQGKIQQLNKVQSDISAYQKQQQAVDATRQRLSVLQQQYDNIQKEIQETEGYSSALENKLLSKQAQIDKTTASLNTYEQRLAATGNALHEAGVDTTQLTAESVRLETEVDKLKDKQVDLKKTMDEAGEGAKGFGEKSVEALETVEATLATVGISKALGEIRDAYMDCINTAGEVIASFADGSKESVNAIAGMASASDADLAKMVENYAALKEAQDTTSESIADLKTGMSNSMDEIAQTVADTVSEMDMSDEATESAKATIQGFIDGASSMMPRVQEAYAKIASAASTALAGSNERYNVNHGIPGYAVGTEDAAPGFALVGEHGPELVYFNGGESVLTASETRREMESASVTPMSAELPESSGSSSARSTVPISLSPVYHISGISDTAELQNVLNAQNDSLRELVLEIVKDAEDDDFRGRYA